MKNEKRSYTLKIYDQALLHFEVSYDAFNDLVVHILSMDETQIHLFPLTMLLEPNEKGLATWLKGRTIPKNRAFVENILETAGLTIHDTLGILDICKRLSVNDSYWLDDGKNEQTFEDLNLFDNQLDETLALVAYTGHTTGQRHKAGLSSEWTLDGQFPKAIRRIDNHLYLFKTGTIRASNSGFEPWSEYFAAQVAECM